MVSGALDMDLSPGSHTLNVSAVDNPSGYIFRFQPTAPSMSQPMPGTTSKTHYDGNGNVNHARMGECPWGQTNRIQTLTWDAFDPRLIAVVQRDASMQQWIQLDGVL